MYLCICHPLKTEDLEALIKDNKAKSVRDVQRATKAGTGCGSCIRRLKDEIQKRNKN